MHASITGPHMDSVVGDGKALSWLFNVLSKEKEADRVLYEDEDLVCRRLESRQAGGEGYLRVLVVVLVS